MPLKYDDGSGRVFTPEEMSRIQTAERRRSKSETRFNTLADIARGKADLLENPSMLPGVSFAPGVNDEPGFLNVAKNIGMGALDVLQRGNFAVAGVVDELFVKKTGVLNALGRVGKELLSGIGDIEGDKDTFRDILDDFDVFSERRLGDSFDSVDGVPVIGGANVRGSVGLALDIFLDPLTYLSGGGSALAKVAKFSKGAKLGGKTRLLGLTDDATKAFTKTGQKVRVTARREAAEAIKASPRSEKLLLDEADRLAVEEAQDNLMLSLVDTGVRTKRAGDISKVLTGRVSAVRAGAEGATEALEKTLSGLNKKTAAKVRRAMGLGDKGTKKQIGAALEFEVRTRASDMMRTGLDADGALSTLAGDIANVRAQDAVLALVKNGDTGLIRDVAPLRWNIPFSDIGFNIGPAGKTLTQWAIESGVSGKMISAINHVMPSAIPGALEAAKGIRRPIDFIGRVLNTNWTARGIKGFNIYRRANLDATAAAVAKNMQRISESKVMSWYDSVLKSTKGRKLRPQREQIFRQFAVALDTGNLASLTDPKMLEAAMEFKQMMRETVAIDVRKGLMKADLVRPNYFPHFIDHPDKIIKQMLSQQPGRRGITQATIGRHAEARGFNTILDVEQAARQLGVDPKMNFNPILALRNRTQTTIEGSLFDDFYNSVADLHGRKPLPFSADQYYKMAQPLATGKAGLIAEKLAQATQSVKPEKLDKLRETYGEGFVGEFLRQKLMTATSPQHALNILRKYQGYAEALPHIGPGLDRAVDGSVWRTAPAAFKGMKGYEIPESVLNVIENMRVKTARQPELDEFLGHFDRFTNGIKAHLTVMFPSFHFRNAYSNVAQSFLDMGVAALNPAVHIRAAKLAALVMDDAGRVLNKTTKKFLTPENLNQMAWREADGSIVTLGEAAREIRRNNIVRARESIIEKARVKGRPPAGADIEVGGLTNFRKTLGYWRRAGESAGGFIENEGRIAIYTQMRKKGLSELEATDRVNKLLFDYDALTDFERTYLKRAIPFYVWTKKNIALQASAIRNQPGRVVNMSKLFNQEDDDVQGALLEYQSGQFRLQLDRNGKDIRMLNGIDLPITSIDRLLPVGKIVRGEFGGAIKQVLTNITPMLRIPLEMAANETFFDEKSLDRVTSTSIGKLLDPDGPSGKLVPRAFRRWLAYDKHENLKSGRTTYSFDGQKFHGVFRSYILSRYLTSSDAWFRNARSDSGWAGAFLALTTGLKKQDLNLDEQMSRKYDERTRKLESELVKQGLGKKGSYFIEYADSEEHRHTR